MTLEEKENFFFYVAPLRILRSFDFNLQALESFSYSFTRQQEVRLYEIVVLVLAFCLVFTKAESQAGTETLRGEETFARDANLDSTAKKDRSSYLKEDPEKAAVEEDPKIPTKQDAEEDIRKRLFHLPRQLFLTVSVPTNHNVRFFQVSYCFRRSCYGKRVLVIRYLSLVFFCKTLMTKASVLNVQCILPQILNNVHS